MTKRDLTVNFNKKGCTIYDKDMSLLATAKLTDEVYCLNQPSTRAFTCKEYTDSELWHKRLGHLNRNGMKLLRDKHAEGLKFNNPSDEPCITCLKGKQQRQPFKASKRRAKNLLELVHTDLCGPMETRSIGGSKFFMTIIDDYSRKIFIYFLKTKDQALECFKDFKASSEIETGHKVKCVRSDNGKEYINKNFSTYLRTHGIRHQTTIPYTPEQNGVAERANRTIVEKARCLLGEANLDKKFWAEASATAVYLANRSPTKSLQFKTPEEMWTSKKPNLKHLRIFGCKAMAHIPTEKRQKWDQKSRECIFVGYLENSKGYRLFDIKTNKVFKSRDVIFLEKDKGNEKENTTQPLQLIKNSGETTDEVGDVDSSDNDTETSQENDAEEDSQDDESLTFEDADTDVELIEPSSDIEPDVQPSLQESGSSDATAQTLRRSSRPAKPRNMKDYILYNATEVSSGDPITMKEALSSEEKYEWKKAMKEEYDSLRKNKTWDLCNLPSGRKALNCKWVYKTKRSNDGSIQSYKARLVVKGCAQYRCLLTLAAKYNLDLDHLDVVTAFLHGDLDEKIYMRQPEGFATKGQEDKVCRLRKTIYGLKQGSFAWNKKLDEALTNMNFVRSKVDQGVYIRKIENKIAIIATYVDDLLLITNDKNLKISIKEDLEKKFQMKDLGKASKFLGIRITRNRAKGLIAIDQTEYIDEILRRFNMTDCNQVLTPLDPNQKLDKQMSPKTTKEKEDMQHIPYREALGALMFVHQGTRPDIASALTSLGRFSANPGRAHWTALKRVFRYLKGTKNYKLLYSSKGNANLIGYSDADWAGDVDTRRSTTGYAFVLQGGAISWCSKKQSTVALSTTEAEYLAIGAACQETIWLRSLLRELDPSAIAEPTILYSDNQSAIKLSENNAYRARSKHIDTRHHFVRQQVKEGTIKLVHLNSREMTADCLTKGVFSEKLKLCNKEIGLLLVG